MAAPANECVPLLKATPATSAVFCISFRSPRVAHGGFLHPELNAILKKEQEKGGTAGVAKIHSRQPGAVLLLKPSNPKVGVREDAWRPEGVPSSTGPFPFPSVNFTEGASGFLLGKRASRHLIFWRRLSAYTRPIPRKQMLPCIRTKLATPDVGRHPQESSRVILSPACLDSGISKTSSKSQAASLKAAFFLLRWYRCPST